MTRNEAIAFGLIKYSTGVPCRKGHMADRYTSCGMCVGCMAERANAIKQGRAEKNKKLIAGLRPYPVYVKPQYQSNMSELADILRYGDAMTIEVVTSFISTMKGNIK